MLIRYRGLHLAPWLPAHRGRRASRTVAAVVVSMVLATLGMVVSTSRPSAAVATTVAGQFGYPMDLTQRTALFAGYDVNNAALSGNSKCYGVPMSLLWHAGEDWAAAPTTPINAVARGVVTYIGFGYPGAVVIIEHLLADGTHIWSMYGDLDDKKLLVSVGSSVVDGQTVASGLLPQKLNGQDNTHLHWEMRFFADGSGINTAKKYTASCSGPAGPGYTWPGHPDGFIANGGAGPTYRWTNPSAFVRSHSSVGTWTVTSPMLSRHGNIPMTPLADGRILVVSGYGSSDLTNTAEIYDPATGQWTQTGSVNLARDSFRPPILLPDGKVLIAAGTNRDATTDYASAEIYDPAAGQWTYTGSLNTSRRNPATVLLQDGRVLSVAGAHGPPDGNRYLSTAEIYDPATGQWAYTGSAVVRREAPSAIVLHDGRVLVLGGFNCCDVFVPTTELYDPATSTWTRAGDMPSGRSSAALVVLADGRVLAAGGYTNTIGVLGDALLFDPVTGQWTPAGSLHYARAGATAITLNNGNILVAGGGPTTSEIYDLATGSWSIDAAFNAQPASGRAVALNDGRVLFPGNGADGRVTEIYAAG